MKSASPPARPKSHPASVAPSSPAAGKPPGHGQEAGAPISAVLARIESMWNSLGPVGQRIATLRWHCTCSRPESDAIPESAEGRPAVSLRR
jgi:hypothetical protein